MYALLCKPIVINPPKSNPVLSARDCRIVQFSPSQNTGKYEFEILEAPPIIIDSNPVSTDSLSDHPSSSS